MAASYWNSGFSWDDLPKCSVLVDVIGGSIGAQSIIVADAYPHVHVVVEDIAIDRTQIVSTTVSPPPFLCVRPSYSVAVVGTVPLTTSLVCGGRHRLEVRNIQNSSGFESGRISGRTRDFFDTWPPLILPALAHVDALVAFLLCT